MNDVNDNEHRDFCQLSLLVERNRTRVTFSLYAGEGIQPAV